MPRGGLPETGVVHPPHDGGARLVTEAGTSTVDGKMPKM